MQLCYNMLKLTLTIGVDANYVSHVRDETFTRSSEMLPFGINSHTPTTLLACGVTMVSMRSGTFEKMFFLNDFIFYHFVREILIIREGNLRCNDYCQICSLQKGIVDGDKINLKNGY